MLSDESYSLTTSSSNSGIVATITSESFFGARHGLETLSQLITFDKQTQQYYAASNVYITDKPVYPYRGVMLDTSRHFLPLTTIKNVVKAMGYNKLNRLHLHLSDTASFPIDIPTQPNMAKFGVYDDESVYLQEDIDELVQFALSYGVSVIPGKKVIRGITVVCIYNYLYT